MMTSSAVLLDTCALLYLMNQRPMRPDALEAIERARVGDGVLISPISAWEIGTLCRKGWGSAIGIMIDPKTWYRLVLAAPAVREVAFTADTALDASFLPEPLHADPADRFLVATARAHGVPLVTRDEKIIAYAAHGHLHVIPC